MAKKIPDFSSEEEEKRFWETHDVREYINWDNADSFINRVFKNDNTKAELLAELKKELH